MPPGDRRTSLEASAGPNGVGRTSLKRHRVLPHPRDDLNNVDSYIPFAARKRANLNVDTEASSKSGSDTDSPHMLKHASGRIGAPVLPPTPPNNSSKSSATYSETESAPRQTSSSINGGGLSTDITSAPTTPPHQRSPPTPDVTPPRHMPLTYRPALGDPIPSSRTESFKTAREQLSSSEEDVTLMKPSILPPLRQPRFETRIARELPVRHRSIGLGLGLESDNDETASITPKPYMNGQSQEILGFDGSWESPPEELSGGEPDWNDDLMKNVTIRSRTNRGRLNTNGRNVPEVMEDNVISPTLATRAVRSLPLQERIARQRLERQIADQSPARRAVSDTQAQAQARTLAREAAGSPAVSSAKRSSTLSGRSSASTVIEAMVVDTTPKRTHTLRHQKKQIGLRDLKSEASSPSQDSIVAPEIPQHQLHRKTSKKNIRAHQSMISNASNGTIVTSKKARQSVIANGGVPVVVIPDRRSSTKSNKPRSLRSTSSHRTKGSLSISSTPNTASSKFSDPEFQSRPPRTRTMSESAASRQSDERTMDFPPIIPQRRSSLSAPTSRNTSRAGSLTAESLKAHNMQQLLAERAAEPEKAPEQAPPESPRSHGDRNTYPESQKSQGDRNTWLTVDQNGDPFFGTRLSTQPTPFSQASYDTAGTSLEVSEALAVSIFPHKNKSLVVVDQPPAPSVEALARMPKSIPIKTIMQSAAQQSATTKPDSTPIPPPSQQSAMTNKHVTVTPVTPPQSSKDLSDEVDSPLRNPRIPPQPPVIQFIPATPSEEEAKQLGDGNRPSTSDGNSRPTRSFSLLRRALSKRRDSDPVLPLNVGLIKRSFSLNGRRKDESTQTSKPNAKPEPLYPSVLDQPADSTKLHPFWRPAKFWDDLEDEENGFFYADYEDEGIEERGRRHSSYDSGKRMPERSLSWKLKKAFLPVKDNYGPAIERRVVRRTPSGNMRVVKRRSNSSMRRQSMERISRNHHYPPRSTSTPPPVRPYSGETPTGADERRSHTISGLGLKVEYVGFGGLKRRISERRREQRSEKLRASISHPQEVKSGLDDVLRGRMI